ncbi:MAG TPA: hypothetical protein VK879_15665 [Candidatus Sulfomarinibacteraceae bacterium]|nr:hypothetical protein [Candidatus Sulfomarinibacteraceae bacterium]
MNDNGPRYHAYLLRVWRDNGQPTWRASLEDPHTGESFRFASVQRLYDFLNEIMSSSAGESPAQREDSQEI